MQNDHYLINTNKRTRLKPFVPNSIDKPLLFFFNNVVGRKTPIIASNFTKITSFSRPLDCLDLIILPACCQISLAQYCVAQFALHIVYIVSMIKFIELAKQNPNLQKCYLKGLQHFTK